MGLDPAWVSAIFGFIGVIVGLTGSIIKDLITYRREDEKRIREERQKWFESRKNAYYKFIDVFSTYAANYDILSYFQASLNAAEYENIILPTPLKAMPYSIAFPINSLDTLLAALTFMKSQNTAVASRERTKDLENLRREALTPFMNEFMNRLRQNKYQQKPKEIKKKGWSWRFWQRDEKC